MQQLHGSRTRLTDADLAALYAWPDLPAERSWTRLNFISSLDGSIAGADGRSGSLGVPADRTVFRLLRSLADVVLVGAGTARAERYRRVRASELDLTARRAAGLAGLPVLAVVSASLDLPPTLLSGAPEDLLVITSAAAAADRRAALEPVARVLIAGEERVDAGAAVRALAGLGHHRVLAEGGPGLAHDLAAAGVLDELCLTLRASLVAGAGARLLTGPPLEPPLDLDLTSVLADGPDLFLRYTTVRKAR